MKKVCIITDSLKNHKILNPLRIAIQEDPTLALTQLTADRYSGPEIDLTAAWIEDLRGTTHQSIDICLPKSETHESPGLIDQDYFANALDLINPDIAVVCGNSHISFSAAVAASLKNIPIAHIHGGEADFGLWDDTLGFGITKMAHLHFTSCETYRRRLIGAGEHPDRVFTAGALLPGYLQDENLQCKEKIYQTLDLDPSREFLLISLTPDRALGSKNETLAAALMTAMETPLFDRFTLVFQDPGPKGFGQIIRRQMEMFSSRHPNRIRFLKNEADLSSAMVHCRAIIGNTDPCVMEASYLKKGVVSLGDRLKDRENPGHMIQADMIPETIATAVENVLCPSFQVKLMFMDYPFEKQDTTDRIKEILKTYRPEDIAAKSYYRN